MIKKEADQERQKKREASIRGMIIKAMIADLASTQVGHAFQTGELRKKIEEPPYRAPKGFVREIIEIFRKIQRTQGEKKLFCISTEGDILVL